MPLYLTKLAQITRSIYSAGDRNCRISRDKIVILGSHDFSKQYSNYTKYDFFYLWSFGTKRHPNQFIKSGLHYTANATTTTQKQSDYKDEQSSFTLIALF